MTGGARDVRSVVLCVPTIAKDCYFDIEFALVVWDPGMRVEISRHPLLHAVRRPVMTQHEIDGTGRRVDPT